MFVYVGTYTVPPGGTSSGIEIFTFDPADGSLTPVDTMAGVANPSYLAVSAEHDTLYAGERFLYAVSETKEGMVTAYKRDPESGALTLLNSQTSHGEAPCYVSVDASGRCVLVANYTSGSIAAVPIASDGSLVANTHFVQHHGSSVNALRQAEPHAHMIASSPSGKWVLATDLGTDRVEVYTLDTATGTLLPHESIMIESGSGPRHFAFGANGQTLYVLNELSSTISVLDWDENDGRAHFRQTRTTLPEGFFGISSCAQILVSPDGRFVYASNRGDDSIAIFEVHDDGTLNPLGHTPTGGKEPRNFAIDPSGDWLLAANQNSDTIVTFKRNGESGLLEDTGIVTPCGTPVCVVFA